ncbi:hypothetical protein [Actinoplanes sp. NPDC051494]|uniref:hypothetical protein n=1 Tax=Actinoplanes sp. NPDC051494 TaxID=3363907 RepID=UPI0037A0147A
MPADTVADVKREILVRHLRTWAPSALHRGRRAAYLHGYADDAPELAEAALRVFAEQPDLVRGRELTMIALGDSVGERLGKLPPAAGLTVHAIGGGTEERLGVAVKAAGAVRVPLLGFLDASAASGPPALATMKALAAGKPAEALVVLPAGSSVEDFRASLHEAGFPLVTAVEIAGPEQTIVYATTLGKSLEAFKDLVWASGLGLDPDPEPLRRDLLAHLTEVGSATVAELRGYTLTETVYRAADASQVLHTLLDAGSVTRRPEDGRLGGDVVITL